LDEARGDGGDGLVTPEREVQVGAGRVSEPFGEARHVAYVGAAEAVDGLPVVADAQETGLRDLVAQGLGEADLAAGDILELVDDDVAEGGGIPTPLHVVGRLVEHVLVVDLAVLVILPLVLGQEGLVDVEEGCGPTVVAESAGAGAEIGGAQAQPFR